MGCLSQQMLEGSRGKVTTAQHIDLAARTEEFFSAITRGDWEGAIQQVRPHARAVQNVSGQETNARDLLASMRGLVESLDSFGYENPRRIVGTGAVVEQHDVCMRRKDGKEVRIDVCVILRFDEEGFIVRVDEYLDSAAAAALQQ